MSADLFILGVISSWTLICTILGLVCGPRMLSTRVVHSAALTIILWPWFAHHEAIISMGNLSIEQWALPIEKIGSAVEFTGPFLVVSASLCILSMPDALRRFFIIFIPGIAFLSTYYMTFPLVNAYIPNFHYDNVPNVWLFIWLSGATIFLSIWGYSITIKSKRTRQGAAYY